jgi:uncharacterized protein (DUF305 family)
MKSKTISIVIYIALFVIFVVSIGFMLEASSNSSFYHSTATSQASEINSKPTLSKNHDHINWTETTFIEHMIPHHEEAIGQSQTMLNKTQNTEYQKILLNIIEVQSREVTEMKQWYQQWSNKPYQDTGVYEPMMSEIYSYTGKKLEREWLQNMVYHHQAAIYIAQSGLKTIHKEELRSLMESIKISQGNQIIEMENLINEIRGN